MSRLEDLQKTIEAMSDDELRAKMSEIRRDRLTKKTSAKTTAKRAASKKAPDMNAIRALLTSMSPEERLLFLKENS